MHWLCGKAAHDAWLSWCCFLAPPVSLFVLSVTEEGISRGNMMRAIRSIAALVYHTSCSFIFVLKSLAFAHTHILWSIVAYKPKKKNKINKKKSLVVRLKKLIESSHGWTGFTAALCFFSVNLPRMCVRCENYQRSAKGEMRVWGTRGDRLAFPLCRPKYNQTSPAHLLPATKQIRINMFSSTVAETQASSHGFNDDS